MAKLYYQGHGSFRLTSKDGRVMYIDPYAGDGYDLPADIILVTHQHFDHNEIARCRQNPGCHVITNIEALAGGAHQSFSLDGITIEAVQAKNFMHDPKKCVGYIIGIDGVTLYAAGDTGRTEQMAGLAARELDYALIPCDGFFTMGLGTAAACAQMIAAKNNIPMHMKGGKLFDERRAKKWNAPNRLILRPGEEIAL